MIFLSSGRGSAFRKELVASPRGPIFAAEPPLSSLPMQVGIDGSCHFFGVREDFGAEEFGGEADEPENGFLTEFTQ